MRRRALIAGILAAAIPATRLSARTRARVGWLTVAPHPGIEGFREGMKELGWIEGENLTIDYAYGEGRPERLHDLARGLANASVQVVVASGSDAVIAARSSLAAKPVVAVSTGAAMGIGESLARPPANFTGISLLFDQTAAKWVELLAEMVAPSSRLGVIHDTSVTNREQFETVQRTAKALRFDAVSFEIDNFAGLNEAIAAARQQNVSGLIFVSSPLFTANSARVAELAGQSGLPAIFESRWIVEKGGLMAYGPDFHALFRRVASLTDRLLRGASPKELPIEQPTRFHFSLNLKTAKALGFSIPPTLLARADEVIE